MINGWPVGNRIGLLIAACWGEVTVVGVNAILELAILCCCCCWDNMVLAADLAILRITLLLPGIVVVDVVSC